MRRQTLFGRQPRPQQFYPNDDQMIPNETGLSDNDSFEGES
jgi:hypothetical protein